MPSSFPSAFFLPIAVKNTVTRKQCRCVVGGTMVVHQFVMFFYFEIGGDVRIVRAIRDHAWCNAIGANIETLTVRGQKVKPRGPHQCAACAGSTHAFHTPSTGAS